MSFHKTTLLLSAALLAAATSLFAVDGGFDARGKLVFSDDFTGSAMDKGWAGKPGKWEMTGDAVKVSQVKEDNHAAVRRHPLPMYRDGIFELMFEFDGATQIGISLNNKGGHVCRLMVGPKGLILQVDQPNANSDQKAVRLATSNVAVESGKWHKLVLEVHGSKMIAQMDDGAPISGENPRVDVDKTDVGIPVAGVSAKVKGLKVYALK